MLVVALTGGIGSGKTAVSDRLAELGAGIVDTDVISRDLTAQGSPIVAEIASQIDPRVALPDGTLDRPLLRDIVFQDTAARAKLESILHPAIRSRMLERLDALQAPYAVLVIPLLLETGQQALADRVLVVDVPEAIQVERVQRRSGLSQEEAQRIIASQVSRQQRLAAADDVIDNSGDVAALNRAVEALHRDYIKLAERPAQPR